jgi:hypothetical protein
VNGVNKYFEESFLQVPSNKLMLNNMAGSQICQHAVIHSNPTLPQRLVCEKDKFYNIMCSAVKA